MSPDRTTAGPFPCVGCGLCCTKAHLIPGWPVRPDGACVHLTSTNRCGIYEDRPNVCRISAMRPEGMSERRYFEATAEVCNRLMEEAGVDPALRVVLE